MQRLLLLLAVIALPLASWAEEPAPPVETTPAVEAVSEPEGDSSDSGDIAQDEAPSLAAADDGPTSGTPRIVVRWAIETATDNFGYNVYRTDDLTSGTWTRLNRRVLPGIGSTSTPHGFRYLDTDVGDDMSRVWNYKVEEIALDGNRTYFSHPVTGESPFILSGKPKPMTPEEVEAFREGPFLKQPLERTAQP